MPRTEVQNTKSGWTWLCFECGEGGIAGGVYDKGPLDNLYELASKSAKAHECLVQS